MRIRKWLAVILALAVMGSCLPALSETAGDSRVTDYLKQVAETQKDPWVLAILQAGASNIRWEGNTAVFQMRSFDPDLKSLGAYQKAEDRKAWRDRAAENLKAYSLEVRMTFGEDGTPDKKQGAALLKQIKNAAGAAKGALGKPDWKNALTDLLFCFPVHGNSAGAAELMAPEADFVAFIQANPGIFPGEDPAEWAPLFYLQRNWRYDLKKGPHAVSLAWDGADPSAFLDKCYDALTASLAGTPGAERAAESALPGLWTETVAETAVRARKGRLSTYRMELDLDELLAGRVPAEYMSYFAGYVPGEYYRRVTEAYRAMPEEAAQPLPKTGAITHAKKGRGVTVKVAKDGRNTYVQLRDADTGVIQADAFIEPGKNVTLKVPEGFYVAHYATGSTWYGTEKAFGPIGSYTATNEFSVAKKKWVLTAGAEQEGISLHAISAEDMSPTEDRSVHVEGVLEAQVPLQETYSENNPVTAGMNPLTGLPSSGEPYTPVVMVLDNAEDAYPHFGVSGADILFQVPNAGSGATKLLGLFADQYPEMAGPVRSGRSSMAPAALAFNAAFAFAGPPAIAGSGGPADLLEVMQNYGMSQTHRVYNLLNSNGYGERVKGSGSHNLACHVGMIHRNLIEKGVSFEERPFLFADEERTAGQEATIIRVLHRGEDPKAGSNSASRAVFKYDADRKAYTRDNSSGTYIDRDTGETVYFANVIVLRCQMSYDRNYIYLKNQMTGSGTAEIFQNGRYVRGAWVRTDATGRLVLVDEDGSELRMQRGKTFMILTNDVTDVIYTN